MDKLVATCVRNIRYKETNQNGFPFQTGRIATAEINFFSMMNENGKTSNGNDEVNTLTEPQSPSYNMDCMSRNAFVMLTFLWNIPLIVFALSYFSPLVVATHHLRKAIKCKVKSRDSDKTSDNRGFYNIIATH